MRKTTKQKAAALLLVLAMALSLTACGHQHTWTDATCTSPKTCSECGKTEGEALGHSWVDATCAAPKTCSLCKETEGEALPHTWEDATCAAPKTCSVCKQTEGEALPHTLTEANYQQPATCTVCGAEVGEKRKACFEEHPLKLGEQGVTYDCLVAGYNNVDIDIPAHITLTEVYRFESDETWPAVEGYEYIRASVDLESYGDEMWKNGFWYTGFTADYYHDSAEDVDENGEYHTGTADEDGNYKWTANFNGIDWDDCLNRYDRTQIVWDSEAKTGSQTEIFTIRVPVGYDGRVVGLYHVRYYDDFTTTVYLDDVLEDGYYVAFRLT